MNKFKRHIISALYQAGEEGLTRKEYIKKYELPKKMVKKLDDYLSEMKKYGDISCKKERWRLKNVGMYFEAVVTRISQKSGFITQQGDFPTEYFVRGRDLLGAIPGDVVLAKMISNAEIDLNHCPEAVVMDILQPSDMLMTGVIVEDGGKLLVLPDKLCGEPLGISGDKKGLSVGEKVVFSIKHRGEHHYDHIVTVEDVFGSCENARAGAQAYMAANGLHTEFPDEVLYEASKLNIDDPDPDETARRLDLRGEPIFTIDGADTKDIDDAISISRAEGGYKLGVHIADVSHYVKKGSKLDEEAFFRGTSIYYADRVVPMLPKELSNGICSLNPNVDRLAFSCLMEVSGDGKLLKYHFEKTVIRSRVKGVYSEVNKIIDGTADDEIKEKYTRVIDRIPVMRELAEILEKNRIARGAPEIDTAESKIITDENGVCVDVKPRERGVAEGIIEEFMLMANNAAASLAMKEKIPFVYRVHEAPPADKLIALNETLTALRVNPEGIGENSTAADLARIIRENRDSEKYTVINRIILRSMMKAKYSQEPLGHYGLVMPEYAHFTSPIRRYADLSIHRILTDYVYALSTEKICKRYGEFANRASLQASNTELSAIHCERECENLYMAEYMKGHVGEEFDGFISGVSPSGVFVALENTVEGMIPVSSLPLGEYEVKHSIILTGAADGTVYTVGDKVRVKCVSVNVNGGFIDFDFAGKKEER